MQITYGSWLQRQYRPKGTYLLRVTPHKHTTHNTHNSHVTENTSRTSLHAFDSTTHRLPCEHQDRDDVSAVCSRYTATKTQIHMFNLSTASSAATATACHRQRDATYPLPSRVVAVPSSPQQSTRRRSPTESHAHANTYAPEHSGPRATQRTRQGCSQLRHASQGLYLAAVLAFLLETY